VLLERLMLPFSVEAPEIDESARNGETPEQLVRRLSIEKAQAIATRHSDALVVGSDQVAVHDGLVVGKPRDHAHAVEQLRAASGRTVTLYTGLALINSRTGAVQVEVIPYSVRFRAISDEQISVACQGAALRLCGSLRADGLGIALLECFEGETPALIDLPLIRAGRMLE
jgi:septum formation protein